MRRVGLHHRFTVAALVAVLVLLLAQLGPVAAAERLVAAPVRFAQDDEPFVNPNDDDEEQDGEEEGDEDGEENGGEDGDQGDEDDGDGQEDGVDEDAVLALVGGTVLIEDEGDPVPFTDVVMLRDGVDPDDWDPEDPDPDLILASALTDVSGEFVFADPIVQDVEYALCVGGERIVPGCLAPQVWATADDPEVVLWTIEVPAAD